MEYLWAPWRMPYIEDDSESMECIFCQLLEGPDGPGNLILHRAEHAFVILNRFPYTNGHTMIVPYEHEASLDPLPPATLTEMMELTRQAIAHLRQVYQPEGFNVGLNLGKVAGAGITDHIHIHIVPRWGGDTNFMATTAKTRVVPEALEVTFERLKNSWTDSETANPPDSQ
jgi:ATP adenylyltransferase